jgi:hypothetical protein
VNVLSDLSKLVEAQILDGALDFFHTAHTTPLYRLGGEYGVTLQKDARKAAR